MMNIEKSLFLMHRFNIVKTKLTKDTEHLIPNSYAYAWCEKVYPLLDSDDLHEEFGDFFEVTEQQVDIITKFADDEWLGGKRYTFYEYEDHFNVRQGNCDGIDRIALIKIFRYCFLRGGFDKEFWDILVKPMEHPVEANFITSPFDINYLYLV